MKRESNPSPIFPRPAPSPAPPKAAFIRCGDGKVVLFLLAMTMSMPE